MYHQFYYQSGLYVTSDLYSYTSRPPDPELLTQSLNKAYNAEYQKALQGKASFLSNERLLQAAYHFGDKKELKQAKKVAAEAFNGMNAESKQILKTHLIATQKLTGAPKAHRMAFQFILSLL